MGAVRSLTLSHAVLWIKSIEISRDEILNLLMHTSFESLTPIVMGIVKPASPVSDSLSAGFVRSSELPEPK